MASVVRKAPKGKGKAPASKRVARPNGRVSRKAADSRPSASESDIRAIIVGSLVRQLRG